MKKQVYVVYDNQYGNIDSIWSDFNEATRAALAANERMKAYNNQRHYVVNQFDLD